MIIKDLYHFFNKTFGAKWHIAVGIGSKILIMLKLQVVFYSLSVEPNINSFVNCLCHIKLIYDKHTPINYIYLGQKRMTICVILLVI